MFSARPKDTGFHTIKILPGNPAYGPRIKVAFNPTAWLTGVATEGRPPAISKNNARATGDAACCGGDEQLWSPPQGAHSARSAKLIV
jgi:hypothetical protein